MSTVQSQPVQTVFFKAGGKTLLIQRNVNPAVQRQPMYDYPASHVAPRAVVPPSTPVVPPSTPVAPRAAPVAPRAAPVAPRAAAPVVTPSTPVVPPAPRTVVTDPVVPAVSTEIRMDYFNCYSCPDCTKPNADFRDTCTCGKSLSGVYIDDQMNGITIKGIAMKCPGCRMDFKHMGISDACECGVGKLYIPMAVWDRDMADRYDYLVNEYNSGDPAREMKAVLEASADETMVTAARARRDARSSAAPARSSAASARTSTPPVRSSPPALSSGKIACSVCTFIQPDTNRACELCSTHLRFI